MALTGVPAHADGFELIGANYEIRIGPSQFPKWTDMLDRAAQQRIDPRAASILSAWLDFLKSQELVDEAQQLDAVNRYVNSVPYKSDLDNYGVYDWWATPAEFFETNGGDCEDYAIAKYLSLRQLRQPPEKMRLVVLWDEKLERYHAVLEYALHGRSIILDSFRKDPYRWSDVPEYHPIFALNEYSYWVFDAAFQPRYAAKPKDAERGDAAPIGP
ncbi:MAG: transglutaminase-like cysteine peptidase [Alphaproteobacteria bacterium]